MGWTRAEWPARPGGRGRSRDLQRDAAEAAEVRLDAISGPDGKLDDVPANDEVARLEALAGGVEHTARLVKPRLRVGVRRAGTARLVIDPQRPLDLAWPLLGPRAEGNGAVEDVLRDRPERVIGRAGEVDEPQRGRVTVDLAVRADADGDL